MIIEFQVAVKNHEVKVKGSVLHFGQSPRRSRFEPRVKNRDAPQFPDRSYLTLTRKNRAALESGTLYGELAPLTSAYGPVTLLADCRVPACQVSCT